MLYQNENAYQEITEQANVAELPDPEISDRTVYEVFVPLLIAIQLGNGDQNKVAKTLSRLRLMQTLIGKVGFATGNAGIWAYIMYNSAKAFENLAIEYRQFAEAFNIMSESGINLEGDSKHVSRAFVDNYGDRIAEVISRIEKRINYLDIGTHLGKK